MQDKRKAHSKILNKKVVLFWSVILISILLVSTLIPWAIAKRDCFLWNELIKAISYMIGGIIIFLATIYFCNLQQHHKYKDAFKSKSLSNTIVLLFLVLLASFISMTMFIKTDNPWMKIFENPGGIFAIIIGAITILGFYLTIETLLDYKYKISSFNELINHVWTLIDETPNGDRIKYLTATPLIGSLAVDDTIFEKLVQKLSVNYRRIDIITLDNETLIKYNQLFKGRQTRRGKLSTVSDELISQVQGECDEFLEHVRIANKEFKTVRIPDNKMPGYYIIANSTKAIIATPFFMPFPMNKFKTEDLVNFPVVTMFGFVTTDPKIVSDALEMFKKIKALES